MPRPKRIDLADHTYHVLNRAVGRLRIFDTPEDYLHFLGLLREAAQSFKIDVLAYVVMPNHWHLLLRPKVDGELSRFMHWLTTTHTRQVHARTETDGTGPLYQGRYKSFLVDSDAYFLTVLRYIERNPVRAKLAAIPSDYRWGSAWLRTHGTASQQTLLAPLFEEFQLMHAGFMEEPEGVFDLAAVRNSVNRGVPYGGATWVGQMVDMHGLLSTVRNRGRQKNITTRENEIKGA